MLNGLGMLWKIKNLGWGIERWSIGGRWRVILRWRDEVSKIKSEKCEEVLWKV